MVTQASVTPPDVLKALSAVQDPELHKNLVELGMIKDVAVDASGRVGFTLELTTAACPFNGQIEGEARAAVAALPGVAGVEMKTTHRVRPTLTDQKRKFIPQVRNVVAIGSGKGGVGKSTVSANLAVALAQTGVTVGLMDADVYGPSIPRLMGCDRAPVVQNNRIQPVVQYGVKVISMGFFMKRDEAVVWRGPMLHGVCQQFLSDVEWGELDYLLIDLPPGTGDMQLSLCQTIPLAGAVVVATPQDMALEVAGKAIFMFNKLNVPVLGIVENMSYFLCPHCRGRSDIFSHGGARTLCEQRKLPFLGEIPLETSVRIGADSGKPVVVAEPDAPVSKAFRETARAMAGQVSVVAVEMGG